jgi:hypothetical protein
MTSWKLHETHESPWNLVEGSRTSWKIMEGPCGMPQGYVGGTCHKRVKYEENEVTPDRWHQTAVAEGAYRS